MPFATVKFSIRSLGPVTTTGPVETVVFDCTAILKGGAKRTGTCSFAFERDGATWKQRAYFPSRQAAMGILHSTFQIPDGSRTSVGWRTRCGEQFPVPWRVSWAGTFSFGATVRGP